MADTRPDRRKARQAEVEESEVGASPKQATLPGLDLERAMQATAAKGLERRAFKGGVANAQTLLKIAAKLIAASTARLYEHTEDFKTAQKEWAETEPKSDEEKLARRKAKLARTTLWEVRKTAAVSAALTGQFIRAARVIHGADLDEKFDQLKIDGMDLLSKQLEDDEDDALVH